MKKWILFVMSFVMAAAFIFAPIRYACADEETSEGSFSEDVPYLAGLKFNMSVNTGEERGLADLFMQNKNVDDFIFKFDQLDDVNYENYEIVFDMVMKSQLDDDSIAVYEHREVFDVTTSGKPGFLDGLLMSIGLKDKYYNILMDFGTLVRNAPLCVAEEKYAYDNLTMNVQKKYVYNTVITQIDCYLREKETGNYGMISRFSLTWDSEFYNALCQNISFELIIPDTNEIVESGSVSDNSGAYGYDSEGNNTISVGKGVFSQLMVFFTDIPVVLYECVIGVRDVGNALSDLLCIIFPFLPGTVGGILCFLIYFIILWGLYKVVKGLL